MHAMRRPWATRRGVQLGQCRRGDLPTCETPDVARPGGLRPIGRSAADLPRSATPIADRLPRTSRSRRRRHWRPGWRRHRSSLGTPLSRASQAACRRRPEGGSSPETAGGPLLLARSLDTHPHQRRWQQDAPRPTRAGPDPESEAGHQGGAPPTRLDPRRRGTQCPRVQRPRRSSASA